MPSCNIGIGDRTASWRLSERHDRNCGDEAKTRNRSAPHMPYLAPSRYHLLIESDRSLSLTVDERVNYSCPSIDVLFESAAMCSLSR